MLKILSLIVALLFSAPLLFSDMIEIQIDPSYYGAYTEIAASKDGGQTFIKENLSTYLDKNTITTPNGSKWTVTSVFYDTSDNSYNIAFEDKPFFWVIFKKDNEFLVLFVDGIGQEIIRIILEKGGTSPSTSS